MMSNLVNHSHLIFIGATIFLSVGSECLSNVRTETNEVMSLIKKQDSVTNVPQSGCNTLLSCTHS